MTESAPLTDCHLTSNLEGLHSEEMAPLPGYVSNFVPRAAARVPASSSRSPGIIIRQFAGSFHVAFEMNVLRLKR